MIAKIPFQNLSSFSEEILFTDEIFILIFNWISRANCWTLSIYTRDNTPVLQGIKLVLNYGLLSQFVNNDEDLLVIDSTDNKDNIIYEDLQNGKREIIFINE
jgi:hypothetical protein